MLHIRNLASGSSGNSTLLWTDESALLIDAGISALQVRRRVEDSGLEMGDIDAILISHEHIDHIRGVRILSKRYGIPVYANEGTWRGIHQDVENRAILEDEMRFGDIRIGTFPVPHDAIDPVGFEVMHDGNKFVAVTDIGRITTYLLKALKESSVILIEANHDVEMLINGPYPEYLKRRILGPEGHLSNEDCGKALHEAVNEDTHTVMLAHLSEKNNTPDLAERTVRAHLPENIDLRLTGKEPAGEIRI